ncbi:MAG: TolC family outer membrane protein [Geobacter sp.]|nr:TolC family outer membrane protein [Geobacter sp.]
MGGQLLMNRIIFTTLLALFVAISLVTHPKPASASDLLFYYDLALKSDPQFTGSKYEHLANREVLDQAYAGLLPKIYGDADYTFTGQDIRSSDNTVFAVGSTSYESRGFSLNLVQPLFRYGSFLGVGQARSALKRADLELEKAKQDLALRLVEAYMDILSAYDKLLAIKAEEDAVQSHYELAKMRTANGLAPITDLYDSEARLAAVSAQRVEAENFLEDKKQALVEICGTTAIETKPLKTDIPLAAPFPDKLENWVAAATTQNLAVLIQKYKAEIAEKEIERQKAAHYPSIDFQADYVLKDTDGTLFGGGSNTLTYDFIFKINVPIYEGGLIASKTREASNKHRSAVQALEKEVRAAERKARLDYSGVMSAMSRVDAMKKSIQAQNLVVEAKQEGFKAGLFIGIAVLDSLQDLYRYKKEYSQARNDYVLNTLRLKHAVGTLNDEDIRQLNSWLQ